MNVYVLFLTSGIPQGEESQIVQAVFSSKKEADQYLTTHPFIHIYKPLVKKMYLITKQSV